MIRTYPVVKPTSAPGTGRLLYEHLMSNIKIPARANHDTWYAGEKAKLAEPNVYAFRGDIPVGQEVLLKSISGKPLPNREGYSSIPYTFNGTEDPVLVSDLSDAARHDLKIPANARDREKVFNPNFKPFENLDEPTRYSNELASMSLPKSISSYFAGLKGKVNYSETDVLGFLERCFDDLSGPEISHVLHGNHMAWSALAYMRAGGNVSGDLLAEFYGQNPADFYTKDLGTVLPSMFFALAVLGADPVFYHDRLDIEVYGAKAAAEHMRQFMKQ